MPKINIKKYSRSNVDTTQTESEIPDQLDNNIAGYGDSKKVLFYQ